MTPEAPDALRVLVQVVAILDTLRVRYHVGGSYASSFHGIPRQTQDIDLVADLNLATTRDLVERLRNEFYVDVAAAEAAVSRRDCFNLIHLATAIKVDIFVQGDDAFDRSEMERSRATRLEPVGGVAVFVKSAEDTILRKLRWYRDGGDASERQWHDVAGILRLQTTHLDQEYLEHWARHLGVDDLLDRALRER